MTGCFQRTMGSPGHNPLASGGALFLLHADRSALLAAGRWTAWVTGSGSLCRNSPTAETRLLGHFSKEPWSLSKSIFPGNIRIASKPFARVSPLQRKEACWSARSLGLQEEGSPLGRTLQREPSSRALGLFPVQQAALRLVFPGNSSCFYSPGVLV